MSNTSQPQDDKARQGADPASGPISGPASGPDAAQEGLRITRRGLLVGGGAAGGLLLAWTFWPREFAPEKLVAEDETAFNAWLKVGRDGQVVVFVPHSEMGQGSYTLIAQMVAGEMGADWRTVAVQPAMANAAFANDLLAREWAPALLSPATANMLAGEAGSWAIRELASRNVFMVTARSTTVRGFEHTCRTAGAAARALLAMAAAEQWDVDWQDCKVEGGFVIHGARRARFADLADRAATLTPPDPLPLDPVPVNALSGQDVPRLDLPAKVDGTANFAGDIRLPDMLYAAIRHGPLRPSRIKSLDEEAAKAVPGFVRIVRTSEWVAALATNWWAAERALDAMKPVFEYRDSGDDADAAAADQDDESILRTALEPGGDGTGHVIAASGDVDASFAKSAGTRVLEAEYLVAPAVHAPLETRTATAFYRRGRLELWLASQAPQDARRAAAQALGLSLDKVILYPMLAGGSFGRNIDNRIAAEVAYIAQEAGKPVQLVWSRKEDLTQNHVRTPAFARLTGALDRQGRIAGLKVRIAVPPTIREQMRRLAYGEGLRTSRKAVAGQADALAVEGAKPLYTSGSFALTHHPVALDVPTGLWRGDADSYTAFFIESFIDEMAALAGVEPLSFRMQMLLDETRMARCLSGVAAMAGWDGGVNKSGMGIACHAMRGSYIAVIVAARTGEKGITVRQVSAMVDCGRLIHPEIARQQIEGGILFGLAQALGGATEFRKGVGSARRLRDLDLPLLADSPDVRVEFIRSEAAPGGIGELGVPAVAPAIANALYSATGARLRELPLLSKGL